MTEGITEDSLETPLTHAPNSLPKESKAFHMLGTLNHPSILSSQRKFKNFIFKDTEFKPKEKNGLILTFRMEYHI